MKKLVFKTDLLIARIKHPNPTNQYCSKEELREVMALTNEPGFCLYSYYRGGWFNEAAELTDAAVGEAIGWSERKVQRYRLVLEKANLLEFEKEGNVLKMLVGADVVALHRAGLGGTIHDAKSYLELKKRFNIENTEQLIKMIPQMINYYQAGK